jgi:hypothetical protein
MSYIDALIPGIIGLWLLIWPKSAFYGSRVSPDDLKIRRLRVIGFLALVIAGIYLLIKMGRG